MCQPWWKERIKKDEHYFICVRVRGRTGACGDAPGREGQFDKHRDEVQVQADVEADD